MPKTKTTTAKIETVLYNQEGKKVSDLNLPLELFNLPWNPDLVHQVVVSMKSNQRTNTADAKSRSEVRGGGRKPWRQKGTGRARHGSIRSPIWRAGGVAHGPTNERNYSKKINSKMKTRALLTVLSQKQRDGELLFVDRVEVSAPKTSTIQQTLNKLSKIKGFERLNYKQGRRAFFLFPQTNSSLVKSFRNLPSALVDEVRNLDPISALTYKYLVFTNPEAALPVLSSRLNK